MEFFFIKILIFLFFILFLWFYNDFYFLFTYAILFYFHFISSNKTKGIEMRLSESTAVVEERERCIEKKVKNLFWNLSHLFLHRICCNNFWWFWELFYCYFIFCTYLYYFLFFVYCTWFFDNRLFLPVFLFLFLQL